MRVPRKCWAHVVASDTRMQVNAHARSSENQNMMNASVTAVCRRVHYQIYYSELASDNA